jgi:hypothetical protein
MTSPPRWCFVVEKARRTMSSGRIAHYSQSLIWRGIMLGFTIICIACVCGLVGASIWSVPLAGLGLFSLSLARYGGTVQRGLALGLGSAVDRSLFHSATNAIATVSAAFGIGVAIRLLG